MALGPGTQYWFETSGLPGRVNRIFPRDDKEHKCVPYRVPYDRRSDLSFQAATQADGNWPIDRQHAASIPGNCNWFLLSVRI